MPKKNITSKQRKTTRKPAKIYPTNERYNKKVPTKGFRIDSETVKKLYELFEASNAGTWGIFFKGIVGDYKLQLRSIVEARKEGYEFGYRDAKSQYAVSVPCRVCGQMIYITGPVLIAKVRKLTAKAEWAHAECPEPDLPRPTFPKPTPSTITLPKPNPPAMPVAQLNATQDKLRRFTQGQ